MKVTLDTVPLYKTLASNYVTSDDILTNGKAIKMAQNTDQISLYWFPAWNEVVVANWTIIDVNTLGNSFTYDHVPSIYEGVALIAATVKESAFSLTASTCALANSVGTKKYEIYICFTLVTLTLICRIHNFTFNFISSGISAYRASTSMGSNLHRRWLYIRNASSGILRSHVCSYLLRYSSRYL